MPHLTSIQTEVRLRRLEDKLKLTREIIAGLQVTPEGHLQTTLTYVTIARRNGVWFVIDGKDNTDAFGDFDRAVDRILARWW